MRATNSVLLRFCSTPKIFLLLIILILKVFESVNQCDERVSKYCKELNGFKDEIERLSVLLHNDIEGKINGILKFMG